MGITIAPPPPQISPAAPAQQNRGMAAAGFGPARTGGTAPIRTIGYHDGEAIGYGKGDRNAREHLINRLGVACDLFGTCRFDPAQGIFRYIFTDWAPRQTARRWEPACAFRHARIKSGHDVFFKILIFND